MFTPSTTKDTWKPLLLLVCLYINVTSYQGSAMWNIRCSLYYQLWESCILFRLTSSEFWSMIEKLYIFGIIGVAILAIFLLVIQEKWFMVDWCKQTSGTSYSMFSWDRSNTLKESGHEFMIQTILLKKSHYTSTQTIFCEIHKFFS